jgi:signal transduction histidine kinase/HAMP domain-containing protein
MRLSLRTRIVLTLVPLLVLLAVLGTVGAILLYRLGDSIGLILRENYESVVAMQRLNEALERIDSSFQFALSESDKDAKEQFDRNWTVYRDALSDEQRNITLPGEGELVQRLEELTERYARRGMDFYAQAARSTRRKDLYYGKDGLLALFKDIKTVSTEILQINQQNMKDAARESRELASNSLMWFAAATTAAVPLAIVLALSTGRTILRPIGALTQAARGISAGNLDQVVPYLARDELGDLAHAFNTMARHLRDIRQSHMSRLLRAQRTSQATIDSFPDPVVVIDSEGRVEMANPAAQHLLGVRVDRERDKSHVVLVDGAERASPLAWQPPESLRQPVADALRNQQAYLPEGFDRALSLRIDERDHFFLPRILPIRDPYGNTLGAAVLLQDVTRFRLLDEVKSNLVATVSHELKTPLTSVRLALHLLIEEAAGPLTAKQLELLLDARENSELLLGRVNNLLDLTRLERGREQLELRPEPPAELLAAAAEGIRPRAHEKGIELVVESPTDLPLVAADAPKLAHALGNLLENAVMYTDRGGRITLSAAAADRGITFTVADTGIGISAEHLPHVFDRFFRVPGQSRGGGTGLGLAIAREVVTAHGGIIGCESSPGAGTVFHFTLPVATPLGPDVSPAADNVLAPGSSTLA